MLIHLHVLTCFHQVYDSLENMLTSVPDHLESLKIALVHHAAQATTGADGDAEEEEQISCDGDEDQDTHSGLQETALHDQ